MGGVGPCVDGCVVVVVAAAGGGCGAAAGSCGAVWSPEMRGEEMMSKLPHALHVVPVLADVKRNTA